MTFQTFQMGQATLYVQARIDANAVNEISWMVNFSERDHSEAFGDPFVTRWDQNPLHHIEERLGLFADRLPECSPRTTKHRVITGRRKRLLLQRSGFETRSYQ